MNVVKALRLGTIYIFFMASVAVGRINDCLEAMLVGSQLNRVVSLEGVAGHIQNVDFKPDGRVEEVRLPDLEKITDFHQRNPRAIIRGICRTIAAATGGILTGEKLVCRAEIFTELLTGHSVLRANEATDGTEILIDMGGQQAFPCAIPVDKGPVESHFYASRKSTLGSFVLSAEAQRSEEVIALTLQDPVNSYRSKRFYKACPVTDPGAVWRGIQKSFARKGTYMWRYGPGGSERFREPFHPTDKWVLGQLESAEAPFEIRAVGGDYGLEVPSPVLLSESQMLEIIRACHEADRVYHQVRDGSDMLFEEQPTSRVHERRRSILWIASRVVTSPKALHTCYLQEKLAEGWTWASRRTDELKQGPYVVPWDDPRLPADAKKRNENLFKLVTQLL
mgnify:FL=1